MNELNRLNDAARVLVRAQEAGDLWGYESALAGLMVAAEAVLAHYPKKSYPHHD